MTIPPAAVIALRELSAEMREQARKCQTFTGISSMDPVWVAGYIDAYRSLGLSIAEYVDKLDALLARVEPQEGTVNTFAGLPEPLYPNTLQSYRAEARIEPPPQEQILMALEAAQQFLDPAVPRGADVDGWANTVDLVNTVLAAHRAPPTQEPT